MYIQCTDEKIHLYQFKYTDAFKRDAFCTEICRCSENNEEDEKHQRSLEKLNVKFCMQVADQWDRENEMAHV